MSSVIPDGHKVTLAVPKTTGTPGDTLVAWGLAIFVSELLQRQVALSERGDRYLVETGATRDVIAARVAVFSWQQLGLSRLAWLASTEKGKVKPDSPYPVVDRDVLREAYTAWRANRQASGTPMQGDAPALTLAADPQLYPFYQTLTSPGTQWTGYNSFVEQIYAFLTPDGVNSMLEAYQAENHYAMTAQAVEARAGQHHKVPPRNPPGFLYPGMNKGPTMRITTAAGSTVGSGTKPDWLLVDRGDRPLYELFLAYVGYFRVARIATTSDQRVITVPIPAHVRVPRILQNLPDREMAGTNVTDYLAAQNALDYGLTALQYVIQLQGDEAAALARRGMALRGTHLSVYWKPQANVFAPSRITIVPLPVWLPALSSADQELAVQTLDEHKRRLRQVRGRWRDERRLSAEQRTAIEAYLTAVSGGLRDWLVSVATWFSASRAASATDWHVSLWSTDEVRRIAVVMSTSELPIEDVLNTAAFDNLTYAIRMATVVPHINRELRRRGKTQREYPFDADYDLISGLLSAAERGPEDFLREFYSFAARYNDETARPHKEGQRRYLRDDDLAQLTAWMQQRRLRDIVPYALLAFGTSLRRKDTAEDVDTEEPGPETDEDGSGEE